MNEVLKPVISPILSEPRALRKHPVLTDDCSPKHAEHPWSRIKEWEVGLERWSKTMAGQETGDGQPAGYLRRMHRVVGWQLFQGNWETVGASLKTFI